MTLREAQSKFAFNISQLIPFIFKQGIEITFGEVLRTPYQQAEYVRTGFSKTNDSRHLYKLAVDFNFFKDGKILLQDCTPEIWIAHIKMILPSGLYWQDLSTDNVWGGDFNRNRDPFDDKFRDPYHFERIPPK